MKKILLTGLALANLVWGVPFASAEFEVPAAPNGYVLDQAAVLSESTEAQLQTDLASLQATNSTQMVVVTLTDLQGYEDEQAALKIGRAWGVGQEGTDNGLVFLIVPSERVARIEVGYGLEGAITDIQSYQILNTLALPRFAEGNYDQGTLDAMNALETLARGETFTLPEEEKSYDWVLMLLFYALPFVWALLSFLSSSKAWWLGGVFGGIFGVLVGGWLGLGLGAIGGLIVDYILSTFFFQKLGHTGGTHWWIGGGRGGFGGGSSGGGFGGFGGGSFGGGGASGRW